MQRLLNGIRLGILVFMTLAFVLVAGGYQLTEGVYSVPKTIDEDPALPRLTFGGAEFHGEAFGDPVSDPIIVVHGGPGADYETLLSLAALADHYFVVFYDQRGTGLSPRVDPRELTFETYLSDLDSLVDLNRRGARINLIGHSFGGQLVTAYVARHPEKVGKVVLAEPGPLTQEMSAKGPVRAANLSLLWPGVVATFQASHVQGPDSEAPDDYVAGQMMLQANPGYWCNRTVPAGSEGWRWGSAANRLVTQSMFDQSGQQISLVEGLSQFPGKVLFLASTCNTVIGEQFQRQQMAYFPSAGLVVIPGSGHEMFLEQPEQSVAAVRKYLAE